VVGPGGGFVVGRACFEAAVQDADESVGQLAKSGVVFGAEPVKLVETSGCLGGL